MAKQRNDDERTRDGEGMRRERKFVGKMKLPHRESSALREIASPRRVQAKEKNGGTMRQHPRLPSSLLDILDYRSPVGVE